MRAEFIYNDSFNSGLRPDPLLTVSEWADNSRILSQTASAKPGRWQQSAHHIYAALWMPYHHHHLLKKLSL
jgi:phage terminase large subunit GpA-like protein